MGLSINHPEAAELARMLAARTGESVDEAVVKALKEKLERTPEEKRRATAEELRAMAREIAALPDCDTRTPQQIIDDEYSYLD